MTELLEAVTSPWNVVIVVAVFGFLPGFTLRLLVRLYPKADPRRHELVAELYVLKRLERLLYVGEQLETALFDGIGARRQDFRSRDLNYRLFYRHVWRERLEFWVAMPLIYVLSVIMYYLVKQVGDPRLLHYVTWAICALITLGVPLGIRQLTTHVRLHKEVYEEVCAQLSNPTELGTSDDELLPIIQDVWRKIEAEARICCQLMPSGHGRPTKRHTVKRYIAKFRRTR